MNKDRLLEVSNLTIRFGERAVVEDISFSLFSGETLGIVGESGSGKSISSLSLLGLLPPGATVSSGSALFHGEDLLCATEERLRSLRGKKISMVFQEPMTSLNPVQRCGLQVAEMMQGENKKERVLQLFREVLLPRPEKIFRSYPHQLSGGQKQRVMIAMALSADPDIIIADEPTTALDVTVQKTILDLLLSLRQKRNTSIIFISHDLGVISHVADRIQVMYRGRIVEQGSADAILHHPLQPYTRGLLACRPPLDSHPLRLPTVEEYLSAPPSDSPAEPVPPTPSPIAPPSSNEPPAPLLSVRHLSVSYVLKKNLWGKPLQTLHAVDDVSFDILPGETLGLVGESGCGKSTLGRTLLRLIDPLSGSIFYRSSDITHLSPSQMRPLRPKLQIVFQDPYSSLNPRLTIGQAIREPLHTHFPSPDERQQVLRLMEQVGLDPLWYNRYPHQLSGGQRQRVCIARALILRPELVVCDESVSALDVSVQAQVLNLLNSLKQQYGYTYLFITHDLSVVHFMADRILVMQHGKIVETGTPDLLFSHPQTDYTRSLIEAIPRIH